MLGRDPARDPAVFGYGYAARIPFAPEDAAEIVLQPGTPYALAVVAHGVQNEVEVWSAPLASLGRAAIPWRRVVRYADNVTQVGLRGTTLYALSHQHVAVRAVRLRSCVGRCGARARRRSGVGSGDLEFRRRTRCALPERFVLDGSHPALVDGYGAYGTVVGPNFSPTRLAWLERGAVFAECHPRGGGELGNDWHFAAHVATKQRTIDDFLGCAHYLIDHHYTVSARLAGMGTSAGGITIGNAIVQQPQLFGAAIDNVGDTNGVRDEFAEGGPANIPEFGTNTDPVGFKARYATDAYVQMKPDVAYPAVLAMTGANDPRVAPWIVAKFVAKLQRSTTSGKPVLLRVDFDAGHVCSDPRAGRRARSTPISTPSCSGSSATRHSLPRDGGGRDRGGVVVAP